MTSSATSSASTRDAPAHARPPGPAPIFVTTSGSLSWMRLWGRAPRSNWRNTPSAPPARDRVAPREPLRRSASRCNGRGQVTQSSGFFSISTTCPQCRGQGSIITTPCKECSGGGKVRIAKTVQLKIPAGVETGSRLRLRGEGEEGEHGGPNGDLYVFIEVEPHEIFERNGDDVYCRVPITFVQAALGGSVEAPTLTGTEKLKIPRGTPTGKIFRLKGKGIAHLARIRKGRSDHRDGGHRTLEPHPKTGGAAPGVRPVEQRGGNPLTEMIINNHLTERKNHADSKRMDRIPGHGRFSDLRLRRAAGRRCGGGRRFGNLLLHQRRDENRLLLTPSTRPGTPARRPWRICAVWMFCRKRRSGRERSRP